MAASIVNVQDALAAALSTVTGLTSVYGYPPRTAVPPFAFVDMPSVDFDLTMADGAHRYTFDVYVGVGAQIDRDYAAACQALLPQIRSAIDSSTSYDFRCTHAEFGFVTLAASQYAGITITVDVGA